VIYARLCHRHHDPDRINFDLRTDRSGITFADWIAIIVAQGAYHVAIIGLLYSCWVLLRSMC
jgi:hypothetical protein